MTRATMLAAIAAIEATERGHVHASRRGLVAATNLGRQSVVFRRIGNELQAEIWETSRHKQTDTFSVPADLRERVKTMLDAL